MVLRAGIGDSINIYKARDAAKYPTICRLAPMTKNYPTQMVHSATVGKPFHVVLHHYYIYIMLNPKELSRKNLVNLPTFVLQARL